MTWLLFGTLRRLDTLRRAATGDLPVRVLIEVGNVTLTYPAEPDPPPPRPVPVNPDRGQHRYRVVSDDVLESWLLAAAELHPDDIHLFMLELDLQTIGDTTP